MGKRIYSFRRETIRFCFSASFMAIKLQTRPLENTSIAIAGSQIQRVACCDESKIGSALMAAGKRPAKIAAAIRTSFSVSSMVKIADFLNPIESKSAYSGTCSRVMRKMRIPKPIVPISNPSAPSIRNIFK